MKSTYIIVEIKHEFYVIKLDGLLRQEVTIGPYQSREEAKRELKATRARQRSREQANLQRKKAISSALHANRKDRLRSLTQFKQAIIQDWRTGTFVGPRFLHNISKKPNRLILRDTDLANPDTIPIAVWLGYSYSSICRPGLVYYNDRYLLFPSTADGPNNIHRVKELRIIIEYTLDITTEIESAAT